ncbi:helix-turn-helix domain-containing protein [Streptacidiphilus sp. BW17]|uniref:helix-turn-helix domain-containing protein n=1 Tax=Streptacidiphilus sp. BW17 TaxID=3156274 RepID=UPI00351136C1
MQRASAILALAEAASNAAVARAVHRHLDTVRAWRKRFAAERLAARASPGPATRWTHHRPERVREDRTLSQLGQDSAEPAGWRRAEPTGRTHRRRTRWQRWP